MCKVMAFSNTSKLELKDLRKLLFNIVVPITESDSDGFGWAVQTAKGVFGERYLDPDDFDFRINNKTKLPEAMRANVSSPYSGFGIPHKPTGPLLIHGRFSTNQRTIANTHPFVKNNWTLIHNGVVENIGDRYKMESTCDTEHLIEHISKTGNVHDMVNNVEGYYAVAAIDPQGRLNIIRDSLASLQCAWISSIESFIFATTKELIEVICKEMKWEKSAIYAVNDDIFMVLEGNNIVQRGEIKPVVASKALSESAAKAFHWDNDMPVSFKSYADKAWSSRGSHTSAIDEQFEFYDIHDTQLTYDEFNALSTIDRQQCCIVETKTGAWLRVEDFDRLRKVS